MTETHAINDPTRRVAPGWPRRLGGVLLSDSAVALHRHLDCAHYDRCLSYASAQFDSNRRAVQRWASWSCQGCPSHDPRPVTCEATVVTPGLWGAIIEIDNGFLPEYTDREYNKRRRDYAHE